MYKCFKNILMAVVLLGSSSVFGMDILEGLLGGTAGTVLKNSDKPNNNKPQKNKPKKRKSNSMDFNSPKDKDSDKENQKQDKVNSTDVNKAMEKAFNVVAPRRFKNNRRASLNGFQAIPLPFRTKINGNSNSAPNSPKANENNVNNSQPNNNNAPAAPAAPSVNKSVVTPTPTTPTPTTGSSVVAPANTEASWLSLKPLVCLTVVAMVAKLIWTYWKLNKNKSETQEQS